MSKTLQFRRGTTSELSVIAGAVGELFVDTSKNTVVVMDGSTSGGFALATESSLTSLQSSLQSNIDAKASASSLATVATSGSYNDLTNKPNIPSFDQSLNTTNEVRFDIVHVGYPGYETIIMNNAISLNGSFVVTENNLKTINGQSLLGSGDITISGGGTFSGSYNDLTDKPTSFNGLTLSGHINLTGYVSDYLGQFQGPGAGDSILTSDGGNAVRWQNLKTINGQSVLGSGNLVISGGGSLDTSAFATKVDLLILDSDDIEEGLSNQYFTKQKVANVLTSGTHSGISFAFDGTSINAVVSGGSEVDNFKIKNVLTMQQKTTPLATVSSKSTIPPTTQYVEYVSNQSGNQSTNPIWTVLNYQYAYFYSNYADIYSPVAGNDKLKTLFAVGNTVRITKDGYWWDLHIDSMSNTSATYINPAYTVTNTNSPWSTPNQYDTYYDWNQNISFSSDLPIAQKNVLNLSSPVPALVSGDKILINGLETATSYQLTVTSKGTWDISINANPNSYTVDFGSNINYPDTADLRKLLSVGNTVTISDNTWNQSGVYLVTAVGADGTWNSPAGMRVTFQYVSGTDYPNTYTNLASVFNSFFLSASATVTPNYTTEYLSRFASLNSSTSYWSFNNYDFLNVGDVLTYVPATTSIQFKNNNGNSVKAITYNNSTGAITYDGIVQTLEYDNATNSNLWSINAKADSKQANITNNSEGIISIGKNARNNSSFGVAIGAAANCVDAGVAIGDNAYSAGYQAVSIMGWGAGSYAVSVGKSTQATSYCTSIGYSAIADSGNWSTAIGAMSSARGYNQFSFAGSNNNSLKNQNVIVQFGNGNISNSGISYIRQGSSTSTQSTKPSPWDGYSFDLTNIGNRYDRTMAIATATVMYKPTNDSNNDDVKIQEIKFIVRTTSNNNWVIDQLSTTTIFAGTGTLNSNWSGSFELGDGSYTRELYFKVDKGTDTTAIGLTAKVEFKVLSTS